MFELRLLEFTYVVPWRVAPWSRFYLATEWYPRNATKVTFQTNLTFWHWTHLAGRCALRIGHRICHRNSEGILQQLMLRNLLLMLCFFSKCVILTLALHFRESPGILISKSIIWYSNEWEFVFHDQTSTKLSYYETWKIMVSTFRILFQEK